MIWTLGLFLFTLYVLKQLAFPRIQEALDKRANAVRENIEAAERQRQEADELLGEYRKRLTEAREQADDIVTRARKAAETARSRGDRRRATRSARSWSPRRATRHRGGDAALAEQIRKEVADLTVIATEKVTRKTLDDDDQRRLVEDALKEVDFTSLAGEGANGERAERLMEEIARVYAEALFEVAKEKDKLDEIREQLGQFTDALDAEPRDAGLLLQPLLLLGGEEGRHQPACSTGPTRSWSTSSSCWSEKHRMPVIFRIRRQFDELWKRENQQDRRHRDQRHRARPEGGRADRQGDRGADRAIGRALEPGRRRDPRRHRAAGRQHGPRREHPQPLGETSKERRPARRHKEREDPDGDQARRDRKHPARADRGHGHGERRPLGGGHRAVGGRRHRPRPRARQLHGARDARAAA